MQDSNDPLIEHIQAEIQIFQQFLDTLNAEQRALSANNVAALAEISQTKTQQVETLSRLAGDRMRYLNSLGINANQDGMEQWQAMAGNAARKAWKELLEIGREANALNQINGRLILQTMQFHQQALAVLLAAANQVSLYGADGQPQGSFHGSSARGIIGTA